MQLYPPGYQPFIDGPSCEATHWCAALTIDSLSCDGTGACNNDCIEPQNFAYIQRDGVPAGPPGPADVNVQSLTPNSKTLMMNQGDSIKVTLEDTDDGFKVVIRDFTTHQSGFMVASGRNGFKNTDMSDCSTKPFTFHPEYSTAKQQNQVPWAALEGGVLMEQEIGHFETCGGVSNALVDSTGTPLLPFDPYTFQTCNGGMEGANASGEGPCSFDTGDCQNTTTSGGGACPSPNFASNALCEFSDAICVPAGFRPVDPQVMFGGATTSTWPVAGCEQNFTQNGDLDFDGTGYQPVWPDGTSNHPTTFLYAGPFDARGDPYPKMQFETNDAGSDANCDFTTGNGCTAPPNGAKFYPFWTIGKVSAPTGFPSSATASTDATTDSTTAAPQSHKSGDSICVWTFGNDIAGLTTDDFGKTAQYGRPNVARFGGTLTSPVMSNPQLTRDCRAKH
jgi:hypothetical protein